MLSDKQWAVVGVGDSLILATNSLLTTIDARGVNGRIISMVAMPANPEESDGWKVEVVAIVEAE